MENLDISSFMCKHVVWYAWSSSSFFPFVVVPCFSWRYLSSACLPFTLYRAHNFFKLSMVNALLWIIVYRELLISTVLCHGKYNFLAQRKYNNIKFTHLNIKRQKCLFFLQPIRVIISHLYIVSKECALKEKRRNEVRRSSFLHISVTLDFA